MGKRARDRHLSPCATDLDSVMGFPCLQGLQVIGGGVVLGKDHLTVMPPLDAMVWHLWQDQSCVSRHMKDAFLQENIT